MLNRLIGVALVAIVLTACGVKLPPITIEIPPPRPPVVADPPTMPVPAPAEINTEGEAGLQTGLPAPELPPLVNLDIVVHDAAGQGIAGAACAIVGATESGQPEAREAHAAGDINFPVRGPVDASCSAKGYITRSTNLPPGRHRFPLAAVQPPPGPPSLPVPAPSSTAIVPGQLSISQVVDIARAVHDAEGWDLGARSTREQRNRFWARAIGIVHFGHPLYNLTADARWHIKDGGSGRPQSDDVVVLLPSREFWDCIPSAGAGSYDPDGTKGGYRFSAAGHAETLPLEQNVYAPPRPEPGKVTP